jgi:hypothetical protein
MAGDMTTAGAYFRQLSRHAGSLNFWVSCQSYGLVEAAHTVLTHYLTDRALECRKLEDAE